MSVIEWVLAFAVMALAVLLGLLARLVARLRREVGR